MGGSDYSIRFSKVTAKLMRGESSKKPLINKRKDTIIIGRFLMLK